MCPTPRPVPTQEPPALENAQDRSRASIPDSLSAIDPEARASIKSRA